LGRCSATGMKKVGGSAGCILVLCGAVTVISSLSALLGFVSFWTGCKVTPSPPDRRSPPARY
jgi:hypothetical protein